MQSLTARYLKYTNDAVFRFRLKDGVILDANTGLTHLLGLKCAPKHIIGQPLREFVLPFDEETESIFQRVILKKKKINNAEHRFKTQSGEIRWIIFDSMLVRNANNGDATVEVVAKNITALKQAEDARGTEEARARQYLEIAGVMMVALDTRGRVTMINRHGCELLGRPANEIVGKNWFKNYLPADIREETASTFEKLMAGNLNGAARYVNPVVTKSGAQRVISWHNSLLRDAAGRITGSLSSGNDITDIMEHRRMFHIIASTALEMVQLPTSTDICDIVCARLKDLIGDAIVGVNTYDPEHKTLTPRCLKGLEGNLLKAVTELLGWNPKNASYGVVTDDAIKELLTGKVVRMDDGVHQLFFGAVPQTLCRAAEKLLGIKAVYNVGFRKGNILFGNAVILLRGETVINSEAVQTFANQIAIVIERRRTEEELIRLNEELERRIDARTADLEAANSELESFSYSVSHDLRAPLRAIDGFGKALEEDYSATLDGQANDYLRRIRAGTERMLKLIDDMLELARTARKEMVYGRVNLSSIAKNIADRLEKSEPNRQAMWTIEEGMHVHGDSRLLEAVMENLLSNAWKFTSRKQLTRITAGSIPSAGGAKKAALDTNVFFVQDNGVGLDMATAGRLFGAFQRFHPATEFPGIGVGLATVRRIIHRHGGRIWAESAVGKGATFFFSLPTGKESMDDSATEAGTGRERQ